MRLGGITRIRLIRVNCVRMEQRLRLERITVMMCVKAGLHGMTGLRFVYKMGFMDKKNNFMEVQQVDNAANFGAAGS